MAKGFGEYALEAFLQKKQQNQQERQFQKTLAETKRQNSLLGMIRQSQLDLERKRVALEEQRVNLAEAKQNETITVGEGDRYNKLGIQPGEYPLPVFDNVIDLVGRQTAKKTQSNLLRSETQNGQSVDVYGYVDPQGNEIITKKTRTNLSNNNKGLTPYQKLQSEEKVQARIDKNMLKADALFAAKEAGLSTIKNAQGGDIEVYQAGDQVVYPKLWKPQAKTAVKSLMRDYELDPIKKQIEKGAREIMKKGAPVGYNGAMIFGINSLNSAQKKDLYNKILDNNSNVLTEEQIKVLKYSFDLDNE
jgi:hypothetical protein